MKLSPINEIRSTAQETGAVIAPAGPGLNPAQETYLSKAELAARLKKTTRTISNWQRRGIIPYFKCGNSVYYKWTEVDAHLKQHFSACRPLRAPKPINAPSRRQRKETP